MSIQLSNPEIIYLFTLSFPYYVGGESSFLQDEVEYLEKHFSRIILLPSINTGEKQQIPRNMILDESLADFFKNNKSNIVQTLLDGIFSDIFFKEVIRKPSLLGSIKKLRKTIAFISRSVQIKKWSKKYFGKSIRKNENTLLYTYWCTQTTLGLGLFRKNIQSIKLITRAHGIDLFEERGAVFCREQTLEHLDRIYLVSQAGYDYLTAKYPEYSKKIWFSGLGVRNPGFINKPSEDGIFRIVSCSSIDSNKRVNLVYKALMRLSEKLTSLKILWHHFGDGPLKSDLEAFISGNRSVKILSNIKGHIPNQELLKFYSDNPVDAFITASASEGGRPVSIQEAQSCGIPVIGTNVGGIPEIINSSVGILVKANPSPEEIADAIYFLIQNPVKAHEMRRSSIENWKKNFDSDNNYLAFAESLNNLFNLRLTNACRL